MRTNVSRIRTNFHHMYLPIQAIVTCLCPKLTNSILILLKTTVKIIPEDLCPVYLQMINLEEGYMESSLNLATLHYSLYFSSILGISA